MISTSTAGSPDSELDPDCLLTAEQVATRWQVPKSQVYRLVRAGKVPTVAIGRYYRFSVAALFDWEQAGGAPHQ
jgi:excisionase family DNA binding protein